MYSKKIYLRLLISIFIGIFCFIKGYKSDNIFLFISFITLTYNYRILSMNRCPKCNRYMKKSFEKSIIDPDTESCEYDNLRYKIPEDIGVNNP